jgi:hypothetical protein
MKQMVMTLSLVLCYTVIQAQIKWYSANQMGVGNADLHGNLSSTKWSPTNATLSLDENNRNIYIHSSGKSQRFTITAKPKKQKGSIQYQTVNNEGMSCKIAITPTKGNPDRAVLTIYQPDKTAVVYKITKADTSL